jgi:hypothetical protein
LKKTGREITRLSIIVTVFSLWAFLFSPSDSFAYAEQFFPKIYKVGGELKIDMAHKRDVNVTPTGGIRTTDTTLEESLRLFGAGYIYHPRFISLQGYIGGGLRQEKFESNTGNDARWTSSTADEYGLRVKILPRHPYNLELYTERRSPLVAGRPAPYYKPVYYDRGVIFRYKKRRASLALSHTNNIAEYGSFTVDSVTDAADGSYAIGPFINSAGHRVTDSVTTPSGAKTTRVLSYFGNTLYFTNASLSSYVDTRRHMQEKPLSGSSFAEDSLAWKENVSISLPWNFQTNAGYGLDVDTITQRESSAAAESMFAWETESTDFSVSHRLYNSLSTNYSVSNVSTRSTSGDMKTQSEALTTGYVKAIPWGRFITGIFGRKSVTYINNAPKTKEVRTITTGLTDVPLPVSFDLTAQTAQNLDENSIIVWVKNLYPPFDLKLLTETVDYTIPPPTGDTVQIMINNLPASLLCTGLLCSGTTYEFHVTYSVTPQTVEYETTSLGYTVKFELFNNLVNPYFGYSKSNQKVLSGELPGGPQNTATETMGILLWKPPYSFTEEYQSVSSNINPYRMLRSILDYRKNIAPNTSLYARAYYTMTTRHGTGASSDDIFGAEARFQQNIPRKNLSYSLGATYAQRHAFADSETYLLNSSLLWNIGKLTLTLSASVSESVTASATGRNTVVSEQYFLSITRKLF